jgi:hypothetical protein
MTFRIKKPVLIRFDRFNPKDPQSMTADLCLEIIPELKQKPLGNDLLSQEVALQVPSALTALTTGFGM